MYMRVYSIYCTLYNLNVHVCTMYTFYMYLHIKSGFRLKIKYMILFHPELTIAC